METSTDSLLAGVFYGARLLFARVYHSIHSSQFAGRPPCLWSHFQPCLLCRNFEASLARTNRPLSSTGRGRRRTILLKDMIQIRMLIQFVLRPWGRLAFLPGLNVISAALLKEDII